MLFLHEKYTYSKIHRETLFQTVIKEKPRCLVPEYHILAIFIIFIVSTCKSTLTPKSPRETLF